MKPSLATALSIAGVLAAGAVALEVNTRVLDSTVAVTIGAPAIAEAIVPVVEQSVTTPEPATNQPNAAPAEAAAQSGYNIEGAGVVTLLQDSNGISVVGVTPVAGYTYKTKSDNQNRIEVEFIGMNEIIDFRAELLDGRIVTAINITDTTVSTPRKHDDNGSKGEGDEGDEGDDDDD